MFFKLTSFPIISNGSKLNGFLCVHFLGLQSIKSLYFTYLFLKKGGWGVINFFFLACFTKTFVGMLEHIPSVQFCL